MSIKNKFSLNVGTGAPSLLTIFLVLSLISFSVLSYMTSRADFRFAESLDTHTISFYTASNESEKKISEIRKTLRDLYEDTSMGYTLYNERSDGEEASVRDNSHGAAKEMNTLSSQEERFMAQARETLSKYTIDEDNLLTFSTTINESQDLVVSLQLLYPTSDRDDFFHITQWQVVQTGEWVPDNTMNLL